MVVSGSFAGCTGKAWCSFAGRTVVALCSLVGSTMVALCSFVGSTGVALCSFGGSTVVAPVGRAVLPVPLVGRENAGRAWLGCPQHSCATCSPHSDVGLPRALLAWPADWACSTDVVGIMGAGMMVWCASSGTPMPLLATMLVTALVVGSALSRPVTVAGAVIGCLAWHPSLFSWCASKLTGAVFLSIACPGVAHFPWPINLVVVEAFFAEGSMDRPLRLGYVFGSTWGLLVVAKGAPWSVLGSLGVRDPGARAGAFACTYGCFSRGRLVAAGVYLELAWGCWTVPRAPPWFATSALLGLGIFAPRVRVVPMAFDGCLCGGCSLVGYLALPSELFADWLILHRVVLSARPS
ncbi:hypothetical protein V6N11_021165 [Hibiscus sabdariffa]|uniref:Uncharacterized protein n=1 Tax=Hibiscus sabdariffa TaxID=183260 RepID=A0ABR2A4M1_9ROSI